LHGDGVSDVYLIDMGDTVVGYRVRVLAADDELPVREDLVGIDWGAMGAELVGVAADGVEALEMCRSQKPDLLITDITMPRLDGLALVRALRDELPDTRVAILTCHADFQYAREAIDLGVLGYVIKVSLEDSDIAEVVQKARTALRSLANGRQFEADRLRLRTLRSLRRTIGVESLPATPHGSDKSPASTAPDDGELSIEYPANAAWMVVAASSTVDPDGLRFYLESKVLAGSRWFPIDERRYLIIDPSSPEATNEAIEKWRSVGRRPAVEAARAVMLQPVVLHSSVDLVASAEAASAWADQCFYEQPETRSLPSLPPSFRRITSADAARLSSQSAKAARSASDLTVFLRRTFAGWCVENRVHPADVRETILTWRERWRVELGLGGALELFAAACLGAPTLHDLVGLVCLDLSNGDGATELRPEVRATRTIIRERYMTAIRLEDVAQAVGLSSSHLGRVFAAQTGETFSDYLLRVRLDEALRLLRTTSLKVYEVADAVGFSSYRYFARLVKRMTGKRPGELHRGGTPECAAE
jgi:two-component system, response regulator YesN